MDPCLLEYVPLESRKAILPDSLKLCACPLLSLDLVVILARTIVLVPMHALVRMFVPARTPVLALTVTCRKFVVSKIRMTDLLVLNPCSRIFSLTVTGLSTW
jgi:hypothetical protein